MYHNYIYLITDTKMIDVNEIPYDVSGHVHIANIFLFKYHLYDKSFQDPFF